MSTHVGHSSWRVPDARSSLGGALGNNNPSSSVRGCICCSGASPCTEVIAGRKGQDVGCGALPPSREALQRNTSGLTPTLNSAETGVAPEEAGPDRDLLSPAEPMRLFFPQPVRLTSAVGMSAGLRCAGPPTAEV